MKFIKKSGEDKLKATGIMVPLGTTLTDAIQKSLDEEGSAPIHLDSSDGKIIGRVTGYYLLGTRKDNIFGDFEFKLKEEYFDEDDEQ